MLEESLHEISEMAQNYKVPGNAQDMIGAKPGWPEKSLETAGKNARGVADLVKKSGSESVDILRSRIKDALEEIREGYEKGK